MTPAFNAPFEKLRTGTAAIATTNHPKPVLSLSEERLMLPALPGVEAIRWAYADEVGERGWCS
jgi:hypothetical protein